MSTTTIDDDDDRFPPPGTDPAREVSVTGIERHGRVPGALSVTVPVSGVHGLDPAVCLDCVGRLTQHIAAVLFSTATAVGVDDVTVSRSRSGWNVHLHTRALDVKAAARSARYVAMLDPVRNPESGHVLAEILDLPSERGPFTTCRVLLDLGTGCDGHPVRVPVSVYGALRPDPSWLPDASDTIPTGAPVDVPADVAGGAL